MNVTLRNALATPALTALVAGKDTPIVWDENDLKMILVINSTAANTLTVLAGNGIQGCADLTVSVPEGISLLKLESGRFKNVTGTNKGKIVVRSTGTPKVGTAAMI